MRFRKVHNLTYLLDLCEAEGFDAVPLRDDLARLIPFAVDERYPGSRRHPPPEVVDELVKVARSVLEAVRRELGGDR